MVIHSDATPARETDYSSATPTAPIAVIWMHVLRGVFLAYSSERGGLQRAVLRHQLKALETGTSIDP
jgi:hypothetical protein